MKARVSSVSLSLLLACGFMLSASSALAGDDFSSGISDDRLSLPEGPGSLEGVGENVEIDPNMALMSWPVHITVPKGFPGLTPSMSLAYSSGGGNSVTGMGWSISMPTIDRMTMRGLPVYDLSDGFAVGGGDELVRISAGDAAVATGTIYRSRFEKAFTRYLWHDNGSDGAGGYWEAQYTDGSIAYFGATSDGTVVDNARDLGAGGGVFTYHIVEKIDLHGHKMVYSYSRDPGGIALLNRIDYVYNGQGTSRFHIEFDYADRDDHIANCKPGSQLNITKRMTRVSVFSSAERIRQYKFTYGNYSDANGLSRIVKVQTLGLNDSPYPVEQHFGYTKALGPQSANDANDSEKPYLVQMGSLGVSLAAGKTTLVDMNGDALPDVVDTTDDGAHKIFFNLMGSDGKNSFASPVSSQLGMGSGFRLGNAYVQVLDSNGDGFSDLLNGLTGKILLNKGNGDWDEQVNMDATNGFPNLGSDPELRFFDYDNDKKIDLIRSDVSSTSIYRNTGDGFVQDLGVDTLNAGFTADNLQFSDMNGDGLLDVVRVMVGQVSYRLNLGWGHFSDWHNITGLPINASEVDEVMLDDLNGDAMADLVVVAGNEVKYALNNKGESYDTIVHVTEALGGSIPTNDSTVSVLTADMNGNGSTDIVWITGGGDVTYLDLFPVRPNLLSKIENNIGRVTDIVYTTSVAEMARDREAGDPWQYQVPYPMTVVKSVDEWDTLSNVHNLTEYSYRDGFYDGIEKQYRGYETVEIEDAGDEYAEAGLTVSFYDVGKTDPYRAGMLLKQSVESDGRPISETITVWGDDADCAVAEVPTPSALEAMGRYPVRWVCKTGLLNTFKEGQIQTDWLHSEEHWSYDGYGNETLHAQLGATAIGAGGCAACTADTPDGHYCGNECKGDEYYVEKSYVVPGANTTGGRWITGAMYKMKKYTDPASADFEEETTYFDGDDFVGLPEGTLTKGLVTRSMRRLDASHEIATRRNAYNDDGKVIAMLDPLGTVDGDTHRRNYAYDDDGLNLTSIQVLLKKRDGTAYSLRREVIYDSTFSKPIEATDWMLYEGETAQTSRNSSYYSRDDFGRLLGFTKPGDQQNTPTQEYEYNLAEPVSSFITRSRSQSGGVLDMEHAVCYDGRGREIQQRDKLANGRYLVTGFMTYNKQGKKLRTYQPYESDSLACDLVPPSGLSYGENRYDAINRLVRSTRIDSDIFGSNSVSENHYFPTRMEIWDEEDLDADSPHHDTPVLTHLDGRGRLLAIERQTEPGGSSSSIQFSYDDLGHMQGYIDAQQNQKVQQYDGLGRVIRTEDPDRGVITYEYDDASNLIAITDARGQTMRSQFDGNNRIIERWQDGNREATLIQAYYDEAPADCPAAQCTNAQARLAYMNYPDGDVRHGYDVRGREILTARSMTGQILIAEASFDNIGRVQSQIYPDGQESTFHYDGMGRLTAVDGFIDQVGYGAHGPIESINLHNGDDFSYEFNDLLQLTDLAISNAGEERESLTYDYDRMGNIISAVDAVTHEDSRFNQSAEYRYDAWYRLINASLSTGEDSAESLTFNYDSIDRILNITSSVTDSKRDKIGDRTYDGTHPHAVASIGNLGMQYDAAGYMTQQGDLDLGWDGMGRLTSASRAGEVLATYTYGATSARLAKKDTQGTTLYPVSDFEIRDGISSMYVRLDGKRVAKADSAALQTQLYTDVAPLGAADDEINAADAWIAYAKAEGFVDTQVEVSDSDDLLFAAARRLLFEDSDHTHYFHHDQLGSVIQTADSTGQIVGERSYYPFGSTRAETGYMDRYGFAGQERDAVTGFTHMGARYLDTGVSAWVSPDPGFDVFKKESAKAGGIDEATSPYSYVSNNPVTRTDPTGLRWFGKKKSKTKKAKVKLDSGVKSLKKKAKKSVWKRFAMAVGTALIGAAVVVGVAALTAATGGVAAAVIAAIPMALGSFGTGLASAAIASNSSMSTINKSSQSLQQAKNMLSTTYKQGAPSQLEVQSGLMKAFPESYTERRDSYVKTVGAMEHTLSSFGVTRSEFGGALGSIVGSVVKGALKVMD